MRCGRPGEPGVQCRGCPRNCKRRARTTKATGATREGGDGRRPASQETCRRIRARAGRGASGADRVARGYLRFGMAESPRRHPNAGEYPLGACGWHWTHSLSATPRRLPLQHRTAAQRHLLRMTAAAEAPSPGMAADASIPTSPRRGEMVSGARPTEVSHVSRPTRAADAGGANAPLYLSPAGRGRIAPWRDPGEGEPERDPNASEAPGMAADTPISTSAHRGEVKAAQPATAPSRSMSASPAGAGGRSIWFRCRARCWRRRPHRQLRAPALRCGRSAASPTATGA